MSEKINQRTPEEIAKLEESRTLSDAELLERGARYVVDEKGNKRLEVTARQREQIQEGGELRNKDTRIHDLPAGWVDHYNVAANEEARNVGNDVVMKEIECNKIEEGDYVQVTMKNGETESGHIRYVDEKWIGQHNEIFLDFPEGKPKGYILINNIKNFSDYDTNYGYIPSHKINHIEKLSDKETKS